MTRLAVDWGQVSGEGEAFRCHTAIVSCRCRHWQASIDAARASPRAVAVRCCPRCAHRR